MSDPAALQLADVTLRLGACDALGGVSLAVAPGRRLAVVGRSGAGKTSLLRIVAGLTAPTAGTVTLAGRLASEAARVVVPPERRGVGLVFQDLALWPHLSVERTLAFVATGDRAARRAAAQAWAARVGLGARLDALPDELSGGEQQRLALARALLPQPRLLLLDEPFAHLDATLRDELGGVLLDLVATRSTTLVLVTHQRREALALADRLVVLRGGLAVEAGELVDVVTAPEQAETVRLLGLGAVVPGAATEDGGLETALGRLAVRPPAGGAPDAALVRPGDVTLADEGAGVPAVVRRCAVARPGEPSAPFDLAVAVGDVLLSVRSDRRVPPGTRVGVQLSPGPFPGLLG